MILKASEIHHNDPDQVRQYLDTALRLTAELDVPDDLRVAFFTKAVDLVAAKQINLEQMQLGAGAMAIPRNSR